MVKRKIKRKILLCHTGKLIEILISVSVNKVDLAPSNVEYFQKRPYGL